MTQWGLDVLFNPAKRHMDEEKQRLQSTREEVGDASDGKRIDLQSGKVVIRRKAADADASDAAEAEEGANDSTESTDSTDSSAEPEDADSPAAEAQDQG